MWREKKTSLENSILSELNLDCFMFAPVKNFTFAPVKFEMNAGACSFGRGRCPFPSLPRTRVEMAKE